MKPMACGLRMRLVVVVSILAGLWPAARAAGEPEDELKSAIVLSFLRYGEWRPLPSPNTPLTVGVVGRAAFAEVLRHTLEGKLVGDRSIQVVDLKSASDPRSCQIVYFAEQKGLETRGALQGALTAHALTIGETRDFLDSGGAVDLFLLDGHITFEVNLEALERTGITISSRLLRFGQIRAAKKGDRS